MIKIPRPYKIRNTLIVSIGIHLLGMGWLGMSLNHRSPVSAYESVMTVDLVSLPLGETADIQKTDSPPANIQAQISPQRTVNVPPKTSPEARVDKVPLRRPAAQVRETTASTVSSQPDQKISDSGEHFEKKTEDEAIEERQNPVEIVQTVNPVQSPGGVEGGVKTDGSSGHLHPKGEVFKGKPPESIFETEPLPQKASSSAMAGWSHYLKAVKDRIEHLKRYPWLARLRGREGSTRLGFTITREGEPGNVRLLQSSGWKELDEESVDILNRVGRFPQPPDDWNEDLRVEVPMVFHLDESGSSRMMR